MASTYAASSYNKQGRYSGLLRSRGSISSVKAESNPFGAALAHDVFRLWDDEDSATTCDETPGWGGEVNLHADSEPYQLDLPLENIRDLEDQMRRQIVRFKNAYHKMMVHALQWHHLMVECERNPQVNKMFQDMQMIRKLTGSDAV